jgi:hypothetical protein
LARLYGPFGGKYYRSVVLREKVVISDAILLKYES